MKKSDKKLKAVMLGISIYWIVATVILAMFSVNSCNKKGISKILEVPEEPKPVIETLSLFGAWDMELITVGGACNDKNSKSKLIIDTKDDLVVSISLTGGTHFENSGSCVEEEKQVFMKAKTNLLADTQTKESLQMFFDTVLNVEGEEGRITVMDLKENRLVISTQVGNTIDTLVLSR